MNIGIDASRAFRKNKSGVEWYSHHLLKKMMEFPISNPPAGGQFSNNASVRFVLYVDKKVLRNPIPSSPKELDSFHARTKHLRWPFKFLWTQGRLSIEMIFNKPDVLFVPASAMPIIHPQNTVAVIHDVGFMRFPGEYKFLQRLYLKWSTKFAVKNAKKIITISEFSKQEIIKYFTPLSPPSKGGEKLEDKIFVTPLGYDKDLFNTVETLHATSLRNVLDKYKIAKPYILYVGRLDNKKNILNIVKAFADFKCRDRSRPVPTKLFLAGSPGYGFDEVKNFIKKNNLEKDVIITGYVADKDLPALYKNASVFLFPSLYEGFGLPVLEAFACGVPVICSNTSSMPEIAKGAAVLVDPQNYQEISKKIKEILKNKEFAKDLSYKGLERAKDFSWKKCAEKTLQIILEDTRNKKQ